MSLHDLSLLLIGGGIGGLIAGPAAYRSGFRDGMARAHRDAERWMRTRARHSTSSGRGA